MTPTDDKGIGIKGWLAGQKQQSKSTQAKPAVLDKHRIAVLPFSNISPDPKDEYFADGMTEELITAIGRIGGLSVIARTSAIRYKSGGKSVGEIGEELNVGTVTEGSIRKAGNRLRITVQLIETMSQARLWSESYDRELSDIFAIQSDIAQRVAEALKLQLLAEDRDRIEKKATEDMDAYTSYLKGQFYWNERNTDSLKKAMQYFERAIAKDTAFVNAYVGLADCYLVLMDQGTFKPSEAIPKSKSLIESALKIDDTSAEAHTSLALAMEQEWRWAASEAEYKRAIQLNPNYATTHQWYSAMLARASRTEEALDEIRIALRLDPVSPILNTDLAIWLSMLGRYEESIKQFERTLELEPNFAPARTHFGMMYVAMSKFDEAITELSKVYKIYPENSWPKSMLAYAYALSGNRTRSLELLAELEENSRRSFVPDVFLGVVYFALGDKEKAFALMEKSFEERSNILLYIRAWPTFHAIHADNRFKALLDKIISDA